MKTEIRNNGIEDCTVLVADEGKDLYNSYLEARYGKECWLGYVYYDKDGDTLEEPHLLTAADFSEVDEDNQG